MTGRREKKLEDLVEKEILMESPGKGKSREEKQVLALLWTPERERFWSGEKVRRSSGGVGETIEEREVKLEGERRWVEEETVRGCRGRENKRNVSVGWEVKQLTMERRCFGLRRGINKYSLEWRKSKWRMRSLRKNAE